MLRFNGGAALCMRRSGVPGGGVQRWLIGQRQIPLSEFYAKFKRPYLRFASPARMKAKRREARCALNGRWARKNCEELFSKNCGRIVARRLCSTEPSRTC